MGGDFLARQFALWVVCALAAGGAALPAVGSEAETQRRVRFNRGIVAFGQGDYAGAERVFAELVRTDETDVAGRYWLGLCQLQQYEYAAATASFQKVLELSPENLDAKLDAAIALAGQSEYEHSRQLLREFIDLGEADAATLRQAHFFLGVAEYKTGHNKAALASLEAAEQGATEPSMLANIAWFRGWIYTEQRQLEEAAAQFTRVSELASNVDQRARARTLAEQPRAGMTVEEEEPISQFQFGLDMGLSYDTDVILLGDDTSLPVGLSTDDDVRLGVSTDVRYLHVLGENWLLGVGGNTFHSWHGSLAEFNVQTYGGRVFLNYFPNDRLTFGLQYSYDFSTVNNDAFLTRHRITPSLRYIARFHDDGTLQTATTLFYSYEPRDYHEELNDRREDRDGEYHTIGLTQSFNLCQPRIEQGDERWLSAALGYLYLIESKQGDDFDLTGNAIVARLAMPMPYELLFEFSGQWTWEDYWQPNTQDFRRRNRHDFIQRYIWALSRDFEIDRNIVMTLRGEIAWTQDDSNVRNRLKEAVFSYDRVIYGLTLSFLFR